MSNFFDVLIPLNKVIEATAEKTCTSTLNAVSTLDCGNGEDSNTDNRLTRDDHPGNLAFALDKWNHGRKTQTHCSI